MRPLRSLLFVPGHREGWAEKAIAAGADGLILDDVGSAAGRAGELVDPDLRVSTRDEVLTAGDYLSAYVLESTLHHLDLIAHLRGAAEPPAEGLARSRDMLEKIAGTAFPASFSDKDALLVGTGRRGPTDAEKADLGEPATKLPLILE